MFQRGKTDGGQISNCNRGAKEFSSDLRGILDEIFDSNWVASLMEGGNNAKDKVKFERIKHLKDNQYIQGKLELIDDNHIVILKREKEAKRLS